MKRIDQVEARDKLPLRRDPYWYRLGEGRYVGFRRMTRGAAGNWIARYYDGEKYQHKALDEAAGLAEKDRFSSAKRAAEQWFQDREAGVPAKSETVKVACEAFVEHQREEVSDDAAKDAAGRFARLVYDDPIAKVELAKMKARHLSDWRARVMARSKKNQDENPRGSFNRNATALRAALNYAKRRRQVASDLEWAEELKPFTKDEKGKDVARKRTLYLNADARRKLVENASDEAKPLFVAMNLQPVRPGDIPAAKVEDLDVENGALRLSGKTGERIIPLGREALEHFKACAKGKLPVAWLVARADGSQWKKEAWRDEIKLAAAGAKLPRATVAYTLRHSVVTDLVKGGLDIFHVAKLAGTSVAMIEKHYGHLQHDHARKALDKLAMG